MTSKHKHVFIGVDGGGTRNRTCVIDEQGNVLATLDIEESSNFHSVGRERGGELLRTDVKKALASAGVTDLHLVRGACFALSGINNDTDIEAVKEELDGVFAPETHVLIHNDSVGALASGTKGVMNGVVTIAGTGTITVGFRSLERSTFASGWGPLLGDRGSGYDFGVQALYAVACAADGRAPPTALTELVLRRLKLEKPEDLIDWAYSSPERVSEWSALAALAPCVLEAYANKDAAALRIVDEGTDAIVHCLLTVLRRLHDGHFDESTDFTYVLAGGLLTHKGSVVAAELLRKVRERCTNANVVFGSDAAWGAAMVAMRETQMN